MMIAVGVLVLLLATGVATIEEPQNDIREPDVKIMAFYVLNYGKNYYESDDKEAALNTLIQIIRSQDVVFMQAIRDASGDSIVGLIQDVNSELSVDMDAFVTERQGRGSRKEQAILFTNPAKVTVNSVGTSYPDDTACFLRPPIVAHISANTAVLKEFVFVGLNSNGDNAANEMRCLSTLVGKIERDNSLPNNIIIGGNLNAGCDDFTHEYRNTLVEEGMLEPHYTWLVGDAEDTTTTPTTYCAYDRIILRGQFANMVVPRSSYVDKFDETYGLTVAQTTEVSSHYPVAFELYGKLKGDVPAITNALNMEWPNDLDRSNMKSFVTEVSGSCGPFLHSGPRLVSPGLYHGPRGRPQDPEHLSQEPSSPGVTRRVAKKVSSKTKQRPESAESKHSGHPSRPHHDSRPKHGHKERTGRPKCAVMSFHEEVYTAIMADPETAAPATIPLGLEACLNNFSRRGRSLLAEYLKTRPGAHRYYPYPGVDIEGAEEPPVRIIAEVCPGTTNVLLLRHSDE